MNSRRIWPEFAAAMLFFFATVSHSQSVDFASAPAITATGSGYAVSFSLTGPSDVEVAILDDSARIIRHLAAGFLGGDYPPPAPLDSSLSQNIAWDGNNDAGLPVFGRVFNVRVRLGLTPTWKHRISTKGIPGSHRSGSYLPLQTDKLVRLSNQIFNRIVLEHSSPDLFMDVDRTTDEIFLRISNGTSIDLYRYQGLTGDSLGLIRFGGAHFYQYWGEHAFMPDGQNLYYLTVAADTNIYKYTRLGKAAPFSINKRYFIAGIHQSNCTLRGQSVGRDYCLYVVHPPFSSPAYFQNEYGAEQTAILTKIDSTGCITDTALITILSYVSGVQVDPKGNIFIGARVKPRDERIPRAIDTLLPADTSARSLRWWAEEMYGSVLKFKPTGGGLFLGSGDIVAGKNLPQATPPISEFSLSSQGLEWMYYGITPIVTHYGQRNSDETYFVERGSPCECNYVRFDVDDFGRVYIPDPFSLSMTILDNNRNMICRLTQRNVPATATALGWPHQIEATDRAMYVADQINEQVACFSLEAIKESVTPLLIAVEKRKNSPEGLSFGILDNFPNPFNPSTTIRFFIRQGTGTGRPVLTVHDIANRAIRTLHTVRENTGGVYRAEWNGRDDQGSPVSAGFYLYRLQCGKMADVRATVLLK